MAPAPNGGFPLPPEGMPVRVVSAEHPRCGAATRVRLPRTLPVAVVRRVVCEGCAQTYECDRVTDRGVVEATDPFVESRIPRLSLPRPSLPGISLPRLPRLSLPRGEQVFRGRLWTYLSVPIAAAAVIAGLSLIQDSEGAPEPGATVADGPGKAGAAGPGSERSAPEGAHLIRGSTLALPEGWREREATGGSAFAGVSQDQGADATLWVRRDPGLDMRAFEKRALGQLQALAGEAHVVERIAGPTPEATVVRLAADTPASQPAYEVTLRSSGPYRYYLATTVEPNASAEAINGAALIRNSFIPNADAGKAARKDGS
jgi:hypothetical protein